MATTLSEDQKETLHEFHQQQVERRTRWAESKSYYEGKPQWGIQYGYDLAGPFSEEEVSSCEEKNDIVLPADFRYYITHCSKEMFTYAYPVVLNLSHIDVKDATYVLKDDVSFLDADELYGSIHGDDEETDNERKDSFNDIILHFGEGGCAFSEHIVIKGNRAGSIWSFNDSTCSLEAESFTALVEKKLGKNQPPPSPASDVLYAFAKSMNVMRILSGQGGYSM
jgi:hypothetical protein